MDFGSFLRAFRKRNFFAPSDAPNNPIYLTIFFLFSSFLSSPPMDELCAYSHKWDLYCFVGGMLIVNDDAEKSFHKSFIVAVNFISYERTNDQNVNKQKNASNERTIRLLVFVDSYCLVS